jgi:phospholipase A1/A2
LSRTPQNFLLKAGILMTLTALAAPCFSQEDVADCLAENDQFLRLRCYDTALGYQKAASDNLPLVTKTPEVAALTQAVKDASLMASTWELGEENKRGTFVVRTYQPNFFLPIHHTSDINRAPASPGMQSTASPGFKKNEAKLQISLRVKVSQDLLFPGADLWLAYTQRSLWQLWDKDESSPFRSTDYQPEAIYVMPVPARLAALPFGWNLRMIQLGAVHQSNGQSAPLSRSWNRVYLGAGFERDDFGLMLRVNQRLRVQSFDDNRDIDDYIGRGEVQMNWQHAASTVGVTWRTNLTSSRGSLQLDITRPVFADKPAGLRWYMQIFSGYGETLLDYNHRQTSIGLGFSLFQF